MQFPAMIAFEYSHYDPDGFPTAIAWTLDTAQYKAVLIQPDDAWMEDMKEDSTALDRPVSELLELGANLADIVRELGEDREAGELYAEEPDMAQAMLDRLYGALNLDNPFEIKPMLDLFRAWDLKEVEDVGRLYLDRLDLSPHYAEQNILVWRATYAHLMEQKS